MNWRLTRVDGDIGEFLEIKVEGGDMDALR